MRAEVAVKFRSGNARDCDGILAGGLAAGQIPPRLLGALTMYLEQVVDVDATMQQVTLFKNGIVHDIDDGDVIRLFIDNSGVPVVVTDIVADPLDDRGQPAVGHVCALVTRTPGLRENDPRLPNYPANPRSIEGERWLVSNAPRAVLMAEFMAERRTPSGQPYGDDPRYFVQWSPAPLLDASGATGEPCDNVSPFAGAVVRFTQPLDPGTVRPLDSLFVATRDVLGAASILDFVRRRNIDPALFDVHKHRTPHLVAATLVAVDGSNTAFRLQPPLGFYLDAAMRQADENVAFANKRYKYYLHIVSGRDGIRDGAGTPLDLQWTLTPQDHVAIPFALDMRRGSDSKAGDAHIRKNDTRLVGSQPRNWWTFPYNRNVTAYASDANALSDPAFIARFAGPHDTFGPDDVRYVNWRLIMHNRADGPPAAPALDSFMLVYRFESR